MIEAETQPLLLRPKLKVEKMSNIRSHVALAMAALAGTAVLTSAAEAQSNCDWYARTALKQQQENEQRKCGFRGFEWSTDLRSHMNWCASVSPQAWKAQAQRRDQALASCAKR